MTLYMRSMLAGAVFGLLAACATQPKTGSIRYCWDRCQDKKEEVPMGMGMSQTVRGAKWRRCYDACRLRSY